MHQRVLDNIILDYARSHLRDMIQRAYDAGRHHGEDGAATKPTDHEIDLAIQSLGRAYANVHVIAPIEEKLELRAPDPHPAGDDYRGGGG